MGVIQIVKVFSYIVGDAGFAGYQMEIKMRHLLPASDHAVQ